MTDTAMELATALLGVERFTEDGDFHPDYLAVIARHIPQSGISGYLKPGETAAECIARNREDVNLCLEMLATERFKVAQLEARCERMAGVDEALVRKVLEAAAGVADEGNVHWRNKAGSTANKRESRDYETMAIACCHVSAAIKALVDALESLLLSAEKPRDGEPFTR